MYFKFFIFVFTIQLFAQERSIRRIQAASDEYDKYTSVGNLGLTITNFGILGNGWNRMEDGNINPSFQYKQQTEVAPAKEEDSSAEEITEQEIKPTLVSMILEHS